MNRKWLILISIFVVLGSVAIALSLTRGATATPQDHASRIEELETRLSTRIEELETQLAALEASAGAPSVVAYQGYLVDNGEPVNGTHTLDFHIYNQETNGTKKWSERHTGVQVSDGYFSVMLGSKTDPLTPTVFNEAERWIEVSVNGAQPMPRQQIGAVPYALSVPWSGVSGKPDVGFTTINATDSVDLTTLWQDAPGMTVTITPTVHERIHILVFGAFNQNLPAEHKTEVGDPLRFGLSVNGELQDDTLIGGFASGDTGTISRTLAYTLDLEAGNSYTISVQAVNYNGNRGRFTREAQMIYWRVPRYP